MPEDLVTAEGGAQVSQVMRVVDTFVAPSKTFTDILRSANCWLPIVLMFLIFASWGYAIDKKVGFEAATETQISKSPSQSDAFQQLPPDQRAKQLRMRTIGTRWATYFTGVLVLIGVALETLVLWGSFNFGLGAATKYSQVFAVVIFAGLPRFLMWVLSSILLLAGVGTENFDMSNPVGTNLGFFLADSPKWMRTAGAFFDVTGFWSLALLILGMAIISRKKISQSATVIIGWWVLILLISVGVSAIF